MNSKGIVAITNSDGLCWKCLHEHNHITKFIFGDLGYGSSFDSFGSQIQLCDKCLEESNPKIWDFNEIDTENEYGGQYPYESEIWEYIKNLPLASRELFNNTYCFGSDSSYTMRSQDWIDYEFDELPHELCKEYGISSPQEKQTYVERFSVCQYPINVVWDKDSKSCYCPFNASGEYGQTLKEDDFSQECYGCKYFIPRFSEIKSINSDDLEEWQEYMRVKLNETNLRSKFE